ncbi:hypothetical protein LPB19_04840 [Marinobacter salinisoli]|uniref:Uncharacterized protein n=1 Tax=Marinobacter salinisoli TaxID=2769486 RepID=A0ABX7MTV5_9GAMM|nr:hypothetical protein [Marinobacter salinisoli]QSP95743.1 hypothetical protein LPB19_04840 [Marinobacter salinisoli]
MAGEETMFHDMENNDRKSTGMDGDTGHDNRDGMKKDDMDTMPMEDDPMDTDTMA